MRVEIKPELIRWVCARAGLETQMLSKRPVGQNGWVNVVMFGEWVSRVPWKKSGIANKLIYLRNRGPNWWQKAIDSHCR